MAGYRFEIEVITKKVYTPECTRLLRAAFLEYRRDVSIAEVASGSPGLCKQSLCSAAASGIFVEGVPDKLRG